MKIQRLTPEIIAGLSAVKVPTAAQQDRLEVRLLTLFITLAFINDLAEPITYVYQLAPSVLYRVAALSHAPGMIGAVFVLAFLLAIPHGVALVFFPRRLDCRLPRQLATGAAVLVTLNWSYLAVLAMPLDFGPVSWLYARQAVASVFLAFLYALSLNAQQLRGLYAVYLDSKK